MRELDKRIAVLRLRLAEISSRQEQLRANQRQFRLQLERVADFAIYESGDLDSALSIASDVEEKLHQTDQTLRHLEMIRVKAQEELDALRLTKGIEAAKSELASLEGRLQQVEGDMAGLEEPGLPLSAEGSGSRERYAHLRAQHGRILEDIRRLRHSIAEASEEAARAVSSRAKRVMSNE